LYNYSTCISVFSQISTNTAEYCSKFKVTIFHNKTSQTVDFQGREALQQTMTQQTMK